MCIRDRAITEAPFHRLRAHGVQLCPCGGQWHEQDAFCGNVCPGSLPQGGFYIFLARHYEFEPRFFRESQTAQDVRFPCSGGFIAGVGEFGRHVELRDAFQQFRICLLYTSCYEPDNRDEGEIIEREAD